MRKMLRWLLSLAILVGTVGVGAGGASAAPAAPAQPDIKERVLAIPGMRFVEEQPYDGYRFLVFSYAQPVDHRHPSKGTFQQRFTLLHKATDRPTVFYTSGYNVTTAPRRSEPTQIVDGNQVSMEYRFFTPSRPQPADWSKLDIWQAASDQHRLFRALKPLYGKKWLATGGSKGGMTATYYRRFYPRDMDGTVAYVAPNDVADKEDSAYDRFFAGVGTAECRTKLNAVQREALVRRDEIVKRYQKWADDEKQTFTVVGSADKAYENVVLDLVWAFWQYHLLKDCADVPATTASTDELYGFIDEISGFSAYTDQGLETYTPYYYQAGTELGSPTFETPHLDGLLRYPGIYAPRSYVPRDIPMRFKPAAMRDIDRWVRQDAHRMLFVYGQNDPWGAERFRVGKGAKDAFVYTVAGGNHGSSIAQLAAEEKAKATAEVQQWAGVSATSRPLARHDAKLDRREVERQPVLRP
ncbi:aminopeptidase [Streptomyces sp. SID8361]|uniref:S28 family serine protease n=1 Tax=Streptomyces TaxID=1883 RepID=UPI00081F623A|nr:MULTISPECIES: S28 family serine protease [unclassified Streptomyces]MYU10368.1 aminopeptidase [Streptomyces sp. SID8361]WHX20831.1 S28 family serine protease [Streptomyces sp. NA07423]SCF71202.1 PS-10 peptidase S37 [Streptomyces sp. MnatMP-M27]